MKILLTSFLLAFSTLAIAKEEVSFAEMLPPNPFVIPAEQVNQLLRRQGIEIQQLLVQLIPIAQSFARPPVSEYKVGAAALGKSGNVYLGVNLEFLGLPLDASVHGEQFLIANARNWGESEIVMIALSAAPCGHCRQFLNEMDEKGELQIIIPHMPPKSLSSLLPEAFGPKDLGLTGNLLTQPTESPAFAHETPLMKRALYAAYSSYSPYSRSKSGVAIRTLDGKIYCGSYLENAAFNPSLSPMQAALVALVADQHRYEEISEVVLIQQPKAKISQEKATTALLKSVAPQAKFRLETREF